MEIRVLGSVEMRGCDGVIDIGPAQQRIVLAVLAVNAGRAVSMGTLIDRVWDDAPPAEARQALYSYVSRLRRVLRSNAKSGGAAANANAQVVRRADGYVLDIDTELIDLHRFRRLVAAARADGVPDADRAKLLREALSMWSETPLAGMSGSWVARVRSGWEHERLDAATRWAMAELRLGRATDVIGPVRQLLRECPNAESLAEVLMRALAALGREAEALKYYSSLRTQLVDELGAEPGSRLRDVHQALLRGELCRPTPPPAESAAPAVPAQLPADVTAFTGRQPELTALNRLLDRKPDDDGGAGPVISVISGEGGVGKTTLAIRWAHRVRSHFPDGQLYVDLRGNEHRRPLAPGDVLTRLLNALGVRGSEVPMDEEDRAARYRTAITGRRMLVVLDNAASADQVRPLLPGTASCGVVVTSRDSLLRLVVEHGALRLRLSRLPLTDAITLLKRLIGAPVDAEPGAAVALAEQCARLPPALRVASDLATTGPSTTLTELVKALSDPRRRMGLLDEKCLRQIPSEPIGAFPG